MNLADIKLKASGEEVQEDLRLENDIEYRFDLVEEDALERGRNQEKEETLISTIKEMIKK